jgi:tripartite-type tricarboxylate transporter receptor subunit TctC
MSLFQGGEARTSLRFMNLSFTTSRRIGRPYEDKTMRIAIRGMLLRMCFVSCALFPMFACAQDYPAHEIRLLCNYATGTGADATSRYYGDQLSKLAGRPVIVDNRPGANGNIATEALAKSKPDGYTIMVTPASSTLAMAPHLYKTLGFDPLKDLASVGTLLTLPMAVVVRADHPARTVNELRDVLRSKPDNGSYGSANNSGLIAGELFKEMTGLKTINVPYKATPQAMPDILSGQLDIIISDLTFLGAQVRGGKIRILAVTSPTRSSAVTDVPTMIESGYPGFDITAWWGVVVPVGTPQPIVNRLAAWFRQITASAETKVFLATSSADAFPGTPQEMAALLKADIERWGRYIRLAKIEPQ